MALAASGALTQPGSEHVSLPVQCFSEPAGKGILRDHSTVLLYGEQLRQFVWMKNRTSREWFNITRQVTSALMLLADHGVWQNDLVSKHQAVYDSKLNETVVYFNLYHIHTPKISGTINYPQTLARDHADGHGSIEGAALMHARRRAPMFNGNNLMVDKHGTIKVIDFGLAVLPGENLQEKIIHFQKLNHCHKRRGPGEATSSSCGLAKCAKPESIADEAAKSCGPIDCAAQGEVFGEFSCPVHPVTSTPTSTGESFVYVPPHGPMARLSPRDWYKGSSPHAAVGSGPSSNKRPRSLAQWPRSDLGVRMMAIVPPRGYDTDTPPRPPQERASYGTPNLADSTMAFRCALGTEPKPQHSWRRSNASARAITTAAGQAARRAASWILGGVRACVPRFRRALTFDTEYYKVGYLRRTVLT